jgi:hypothetical protein
MKHNPSRVIAKIRDLETLRRYGLNEDEIIELQNLKREGDEKVQDFEVLWMWY